MIYLVVFFGAGIGGAARHAVNTGDVAAHNIRSAS